MSARLGRALSGGAGCEQRVTPRPTGGPCARNRALHLVPPGRGSGATGCARSPQPLIARCNGRPSAWSVGEWRSYARLMGRARSVSDSLSIFSGRAVCALCDER